MKREREILHRSEKGEKEKEPCEEREREGERKDTDGRVGQIGIMYGF